MSIYSEGISVCNTTIPPTLPLRQALDIDEGTFGRQHRLYMIHIFGGFTWSDFSSAVRLHRCPHSEHWACKKKHFT